MSGDYDLNIGEGFILLIWLAAVGLLAIAAVVVYLVCTLIPHIKIV